MGVKNTLTIIIEIAAKITENEPLAILEACSCMGFGYRLSK
jgi:hypothetical protein